MGVSYPTGVWRNATGCGQPETQKRVLGFSIATLEPGTFFCCARISPGTVVDSAVIVRLAIPSYAKAS